MAAARKRKAKKDTSFATWKFSLENTVNADPLADGPCLKLLRAYLDWMGSPDARPYLSIISLKVSTSLHEGAISRARGIMVKLGYFVPDGITSTGVVKYKIVNSRENLVLDHQIQARETLKAIEADKKQKFRQKRRSANDSSADTADPMSTAATAELSGKRVCDSEGDSSADTADNYVENSVEAISNEEKEPTIGDTFVIPSDPNEARMWVHRNCADKSRLAWALGLLAEKKLTSEIMGELRA